MIVDWPMGIKLVICLWKPLSTIFETLGKMRFFWYFFEIIALKENEKFLNIHNIIICWTNCLISHTLRHSNVFLLWLVPTPASFVSRKEQLECFSADLVACINTELRALVAAGCKHIQIDEPLLVREPDVALGFGIDALTACLEVM